jgi:hypothetical protein
VAPTTTAPLASDTVPRMPVSIVWACTIPAQEEQQ